MQHFDTRTIRRLGQYGLAAAAFIQADQSEAQIRYRSFDPDSVIVPEWSGGDRYGEIILDLDANGTTDIRLEAFSAWTDTWSAGGLGQAIQMIGGAEAASTTTSTFYNGAIPFSPGDLISSAAGNWRTGWHPLDTFTCGVSPCYSGGFFQFNKVNAIGVRVPATSGGTWQYGFVRVKRAASLRLKVYDWALNEVPDAPFAMVPPSTLNSSKATEVDAVLTGSTGTPADIRVSFDAAAAESRVREYRTYLVPFADFGSLTLLDIQDLPPSHYAAVTPDGSSSYSVNFSATVQDVFGNLPSPSIPYVTVVLSQADGIICWKDVVSSRSAPFAVPEPRLGSSESTLTVFREPLTLGVRLLGKSEAYNRVELWSVTGTPVWSGGILGGSINIPTQDLAAGTYLVRVSGEGVEPLTQKVVWLR